MEILICIIIILYLRSAKTSNSSSSTVKIENLPVKNNPKGYFEEDAFTEVYFKLKK